jgi:mono/diheme cytochrome c family protein
MRNFIAGVVAAVISASLLSAIIWTALLPRLDWSASKPPSVIEQAVAQNVLGRWVRRNADSSTNPLSPTPETLKAARTEYEAHCAVCHALDGSGHNHFEAVFYPPVAKLTGGVQRLSDSELYFIVANGIRNTAMPAFAKAHSHDDMWRAVLWVRHLANLTPDEKAAIEKDVQSATKEHEKTMEQGMGSASQPE